MQPYTQRISLELSRTEFPWNTDMLDTRNTMKAKYKKGQAWCPHFPLGRSVGAAEKNKEQGVKCIMQGAKGSHCELCRVVL